jgi:N-acetylneuraminic acid mutarotase
MKKCIHSEIFVIAIIVASISCFSIYAQNQKSKNNPPTMQKVTQIPAIQSDNTRDVLYDQTSGVTANAYTSQDFETAYDAYDNQIADNFTATGTWTINQIVVAGDYSVAGPANGFNIFFYSNSGGIPGAIVYSALNQPYNYDGLGTFTVNISPAAVLTAGDYWISVQCRMDYGTGGQWFWNTVSGAYGNVAQWQNPGGGFGVGCLTWAPITGCLTAANTDMCFALNYITGPGPAANPDPANGATGVSAPNVTLSWTNPSGTTSNAVYFGTSPGSLTQIYSGTPISSIGRTGLSYFTQYYWRVDETDGTGTTTGPVWSFTTIPDPAGISLPYTQTFDASTFPPYWTQSSTDWAISLTNYAGGTPNEMRATWFNFIGTTRLIVGPINTAGYTNLNLAFRHYYDDYAAGVTMKIQSSLDGNTWTDEAFSIISGGGNQGPALVNVPIANNVGSTTYIAWVIDGDHYQYDLWYIDNVNITGPCPVTAPSNPSPADGATGVAITGTSLSWTNGASTNDVEVWFGPLGSVTKVYDGPAITTWPLGTLNYSVLYQWKIVCKNPVCSVEGPLWSFTTMQDPSLIFFEPFNVLTCWTPIGPLGTTNWSLSTSNYAGGGAAPELMLSWTPSFNGLSQLLSCNITTTAVGQLHNLELKHFLDYFGSPAPTMGIGISYDNGSSYTTIWEFTPIANVGPETIQTTFTATAGTFQLVLYCSGDSYNIDYWYVDDIKVGLPQPNDVGTVSIDMAYVNPGTVVPKATVKNFGTNTNSFTVQMTITGGYTSTKNVTNLASGATQQVSFDNWNVSTIGQYTVNVCTQLGTDTNPTNDCKTKDVTVTNWFFGSLIPGTTYLGGSASYVSGSTAYLFSIGGNTLSGLSTEGYKYNVNTDTWTTIAPLPEGRLVFATAVVGDYLYVIGGYNTGGISQSTVYRYDIVGDSWTIVASLPGILGWGKAAVYNNRIYVAGGYNDVTVQSTVYVYNVATDTWSTATSMPAARFGGAFSATGNKLVYVGGADLSLTYNTVFVGTIDGTDPNIISWTTMMNPYPGTNKITTSEGLLNFTASAISKKNPDEFPDAVPYPPGTMYRFDAAPWGDSELIVAGGSPTASWIPANPNPCYSYNPTTDTWTQKENVPIPILGAALGSVNTGSVWKLVVATGYTGSVVTDVTQVFTESAGASTFQLTVNVANGWNMVSIPGLHPVDQNVNTWWQYRDPGANVFKYSGGYQVVSLATPGTGYWMKHAGARTYNTGDEWPAGGIQIVAHDPIPGTIGWNLIGGYETSVATSGMTTTPPGLIVFPLYRYSSGYQVATTLDPGYGYWVKLSGAGQINIPGSMAKGSGDVAEYFPENWGRIIVTDASGINYTLYAVNGEVDLNLYELPPAPPAGMFDIRYGSGRIAEDINSAIQTIELNGVTYPVTVRVENIDIRLMDETGKGVNVNLKSGEEVVISDGTIRKLMVSGELLPTVYSLEQNYPNPFNPSTVIEFSLPEDVSNVKLSIYNALGEKVAELVNSSLTAGKYQYQWNASNVATGMYIYELRTDKFVSVKKMVLVK